MSEVMHRQLHWLDVVNGVNYKIGLLVYKCPHGLTPGFFILFFNTIFVSSHMYPENPERSQVIVGSMNLGYLSDGYLSDQCIPASTFAGRANMRSSSRLDRLLYVPRTKTKTLGPRGFYYASSAVWNSPPVDLRDPGLSLHSFRLKLKSHFFTID